MNGRSNTQTEVVVVGCGPTGLWLACELALAHVHVTVLEKLAQPTGFSKALGLQSRSMEILEHRGILDRFTAGNPTVLFLNFGMFPVDLRKLEFPHPYPVIIPQARVEALLEEHARALGAEIRRGHELIGLQQDAQSVKAEVRTQTGAYEISAQYLVGCDGGHSAVRKQSGIAFPGLDPTVIGRLGDVKLEAAGLEQLKRGVPELGGREFGIVRTRTGNFAIVPLGSGIYRLAAIEWDQEIVDHDTATSLSELQDAIQRVIGLNLPMHDPVWLSRATDSSRLAERYRDGRIFLAGDAAHVHWAYGGKGLQTGLQDAGNLAWKLAAQIHGWAPPPLLETYHTERHPVGERLMTFTRAQEALARPGEHVTALRDLFGHFLQQEQTYRAIVEETTDVDVCYDMGGKADKHPLVGRWAPNLVLHGETGTTSLANLMSPDKGLLVDLSEHSVLRDFIAKWDDRVRAVSARCYERSFNLDAMLVRPDGYVAWVLGPNTDEQKAKQTLCDALEKWFGVLD
jgi:2-polyprenyl-6-methoxyphenol hydroxylase-like FAD-dependent oxidoreductase